MKWSEAKRVLQKKDKDELVEYMKRLFNLSAENKSFFEANLGASESISPTYYKREISIRDGLHQ